MFNESFWKDMKVEDTLKGYSRKHNGLINLQNHKVILRRDYLQLQDQVKVISGGGSGHEPSFAGFVGPGMLSAAVYGEIFTPPTPKDIIQTIRQLSQNDKKGILLIVGNNIGDRLTFGVAYEKALKQHYKIKMITMQDNCSSFYEKTRENSSGIILLYKFAGALSDKFFNLDKIYEECMQYAFLIKSSNLFFKPHKTFSRTTSMTWNENEVCLGMGLQGEPSGKVYTFSTIKDTVELILGPLKDLFNNENNEKKNTLEETVHFKTSPKYSKTKPRKFSPLSSDESLDKNQPLILMINYLSGFHGYEQNIFANQLMEYFDDHQVKIIRCISGTFYTSLDAQGITISIIPAFLRNVELLDAPCSAPKWPRILCQTCLDPTVSPETILPISEPPKIFEPTIDGDGPSVNIRTSRIIRAMLICAVDACLSCDSHLKNLDLESKGKQGFHLTTIFLKLKETLEKDELTTLYPKKMLKEMLLIFESESAGFYGILYALMIESSISAFELEDIFITPRHWNNALNFMIDILENYGGANLGEGTLLDVLVSVEKAILPLIKRQSSYQDILQKSAEAAEAASAKTAFRNKQHFSGPDPEAQRISVFIRALYEAFKLVY